MKVPKCPDCDSALEVVAETIQVRVDDDTVTDEPAWRCQSCSILFLMEQQDDEGED